MMVVVNTFLARLEEVQEELLLLPLALAAAALAKSLTLKFFM